MSIIIDFDGDYFDILNDTSYNNHTPYVVDPKTLSCEIEPMAYPAALITCLILITIFLLAIPGNLLVGWVIGTCKHALTPSDVYLFHLTIADSLMALTLPFLAAALIRGWVFGDFMCKFLNLIIEANFYTSILFLACISIDRYLVIVRSSQSFKRRQRMCSWVLCGAVWVYGGALALPSLFNDVAKLDSDPSRAICSKNFDIGSSTTWRLATRVFLHVFGFFLPLVVMVICYGITIERLLRTQGFQKHRAMKVIIAVVIAFLLCWTPYHITMVVDTMLRADLISFDCNVRRSVTLALDITNSLALFHSCINPVLYAFVGEKFRRNMMLLFHRKVRLQKISVSKSSRSTSHTSEASRPVF
ncbi:C-X-C chemokine receptor type 2-like [Antennarius striatus]|uniref:C-X-C chemokine receptor type 2-like n=1 Tax=Antennarius striatus TaxID=241820 RepID=UPI0035B0C58E